MKREISCVLLGAICAGAAQAQQGPSLVPNGGFEAVSGRQGDVELPEGWTLTLDPDDQLAKGSLSPQARTGQRSFCLERAMGRRDTVLESAGFPVKPGATYTVSVWLRMESRLPRDTVNVRVVAGEGGRSSEASVTRQWRQSSFTFVARPGATTASIRFQRPGGVADRLYIDDVEVRETEAVKAEAEGHPPYRTDLTDFQFPAGGAYVSLTADQIAAVKLEWAGRDIREQEWVQAAEEFLQRPIYFFKEGYAPRATWLRIAFNLGLVCPKCATRMGPRVHPDGSHEMHCRRCDEAYRTDAHLRCARALYNRSLATAMDSVGRAYALTGDPRYAQRLKEVLLGWAERYKSWVVGPNLAESTLNEAEALVRVAEAWEHIRDSEVISTAERRKIVDDLLRPLGQFHLEGGLGDRLNNRSAIYSRAVMATGVAIHDKGFVDHALNNADAGFHALAGGIFDSSGLSFEGFGYQSYALSGLAPIAEMAHRIGINVYGDPAYRRIFLAPLQVLLPGEDGRRWESRYGSVCPRFAEAGQPLEYPFDEEGQLKAVPKDSFNFDQFGYAVLRSGEGADQLYLSMEYGIETMFMGHAPAPKFATLFYANRQLLTPRGAASYGSELCGAWSRRTLAHNALTVDDKDQWGRTESRLIAFETAPRVKVARAEDDQTYGDVTADRTLFLTDGYVVDLCAGQAVAGPHRFDLCYRYYGNLACDLPFQPRSGPLGNGHGYQYLTNVRSARTAADWSAEWRQGDDSALRLLVVGGPETEVIACDSPDNRSADEKVDAIVARRWSEDAVFASVWEPYRGRPAVAGVRRLPVAQGDAAGVGVEVVRDGQPGAECFLAAYAPGARQYGDIELDGKIAAGRWSSPEAAPGYAYLVKGVLLRRGARSLEANLPATLYVEQIAPDRLLVRTGSESAGALALAGAFPGGAKVTKAGEAVAAKVERESSLTFAVTPETSYEVAGVTDWQRIRLEREGPAEESAQPAAAPAVAEPAPEPAIQTALAPDGTLAGKNKIPNGGFEINYKTRPDVASPWETWCSYHWVKWRPRYDCDAEVAHSGRHSLRIRQTNWANQATQDGWIEQRVPGVGANKTYTLSAWVKSDLAPTRVRLCLYGFNPKWGSDYEGGVSPVFEIGTEWQRITWTRTFGPEITDVRVMVKREHQVMGGDVWIDDVQLEEGAAATDFTPDAWTQAARK